MNNIRAILAAAGLVVANGATGTAQANNDFNRVTLYTSAVHTGVIACNAINVSKKALNITISIFDGVMEPGKNSPNLLEGPTSINTPPGMEATIDHGTPTDDNEGYCVSGASNRDDVRAVQNAVLAGTRSVDGGQTFFPFFITRVLEAR